MESLPNEILDMVIEYLIISIGIYRAFILRTVNKRFNSSILFAICDKQILDINHPATPELIIRMPIAPKGRVLLVKSLSEEVNRDDALFVISRVNQVLDELTKPSKEQQAEQHRMISEAIAERYPYRILNLLDGTDTSMRTNAHNVLMGAIVIDIAAFRGYLQIVLYLLDCGADPCRDDYGEDWNWNQGWHWSHFNTRSSTSALGAAVRGGHEGVIRLLMQPEYSPSPLKAEYSRVILDGVEFGRIRSVQSLLQAMGKPLSDFASFGHLIFYTAVFSNQADLVQILLDDGIDVNTSVYDLSGLDYAGVMCYAVSTEHPRMVRILLDHGIYTDCAKNVNGYDESGMPIAVAAKLGHEEVVDLILAHSTDPESLERAFVCAAEGGQAHLMNKLWKKDPQLHTKWWPRDNLSPPEDEDTDLRRTVGVEALYRAILAKSPAVISTLAEHGVSLNEKYLGRCLMVLAKFESARWIADFMVSLGAEDVDIDHDDVFIDCAEETTRELKIRAGVFITKQTWEWGSKY